MKYVIFFLSSPHACARIPLDLFVALHPVRKKKHQGDLTKENYQREKGGDTHDLEPFGAQIV